MAEYFTDLGIGNYRIIQDTDDYAFSQDSVFLANMAKLGVKDSVLDLGCGSGILATLALVKKSVKKATGVEVQEKFCDMARRSAQLNCLDLEIINCDVNDIRNHIAAESFDKVLCNPPYFSQDSPKASNNKGIARSESTASLDCFVKAAAYSLRFGGDLWIVLKATRMAELFVALENSNLSAKELILIYPKLSRGVDSVIVSAKKGGKSGLVTKTFIAQNEDGSFTQEYLQLYGQ